MSDSARQGTVVLEVRLGLAGHVDIEDAATELRNVLLFTADRRDRYEVDHVVVVGRQQTAPPTDEPPSSRPSAGPTDGGLF